MPPIRNKYRPTGRDKVETSPTGKARCGKCRRPIAPGSVRIGIEDAHVRHNSVIYYHTYYHEECCPSKTLRLGGFTPEQCLSREREQKQLDTDIICQRNDLYQALRQLRYELMSKFDLGKPYYVFTNEALNELVLKMPATREELLRCKGFGPKNCNKFGSDILSTILRYRMGQCKTEQDATPRVQRALFETPDLKPEPEDTSSSFI